MAASPTKEQLIYRASLCESAQRYDDMVDVLKQLIRMDPNLNTVERHLLSIAYKEVMLSRRASWRTLSTIEQETFTEEQQTVVETYREQVEQELTTFIQEILSSINDVLLPNASDNDSKVFFLKMKGDYYRYMYEIASGEERTAVVELSRLSYQEARDIATATLKPYHTTRLGLALNYAVFLCEIMNNKDEARQMAKTARDEAAAALAIEKTDQQQDSEDIMRRLQECVDSWMPKTGNNQANAVNQ